jgi:hypothetical protein
MSACPAPVEAASPLRYDSFKPEREFALGLDRLAEQDAVETSDEP